MLQSPMPDLVLTGRRTVCWRALCLLIYSQYSKIKRSQLVAESNDWHVFTRRRTVYGRTLCLLVDTVRTRRRSAKEVAVCCGVVFTGRRGVYWKA